jgi:urea transport system substrate-binding protein
MQRGKEMKKLSRREFLKYTGMAAAMGAGAGFLGGCAPAATPEPAEEEEAVSKPSGEPIKVGALCPMTGIAAWSGEMMRDCTQLAVNEINAAGGLLGRPVEIVLEDTETNPEKGVAKAQRLILQENVDVIIGTLFSSVRNAVKEVTEENGMLLLNPTYYEGMQCGKYYFSTGSVANQQFSGSVPWLVENEGPKFFLVGSDYQWPRGSFEVLKPILEEAGGEVVGEEYVPLGNTEWSALIRRIDSAAPDVLMRLVAGSDGVAFISNAYDFGLLEKMATAGAGVAEAWGSGLRPEVREGVYMSVDYTMAIDSPENRAFLAAYRGIAGETAVLDPIPEHQYENMRLYGMAVEKAGSVDKDAVAEALTEVTLQGPAGPVSFSKENHHAVLTYYLTRMDKRNKFEIVLVTPDIVPEPGCSL